MLLRRVLRRRLVRVSVETEVLRRVLRRGGCYRRRLEGAYRRQKHAFSQSTAPFACTYIYMYSFWRGCKNRVFGKQGLCMRDPRPFRHFRRLQGGYFICAIAF